MGWWFSWDCGFPGMVAFLGQWVFWIDGSQLAGGFPVLILFLGSWFSCANFFSWAHVFPRLMISLSWWFYFTCCSLGWWFSWDGGFHVLVFSWAGGFHVLVSWAGGSLGLVAFHCEGSILIILFDRVTTMAKIQTFKNTEIQDLFLLQMRAVWPTLVIFSLLNHGKISGKLKKNYFLNKFCHQTFK